MAGISLQTYTRVVNEMVFTELADTTLKNSLSYFYPLACNLHSHNKSIMEGQILKKGTKIKT